MDYARVTFSFLDIHMRKQDRIFRREYMNIEIDALMMSL